MLFKTYTFKNLAFLCLLFCVQTKIHAITYTLNSVDYQSLDWSDANIWTPNGVPGANDKVIINSPNNFLTAVGDITVKSLTINNIAYIFGTGTLTVTENLDTHYPLFWQKKLVIGANATATFDDDNFSSTYTNITFYEDLVVNGTLTMQAKDFSGTKVTVNGTLTQKEGDLSASIYINQGGTLNVNSPQNIVNLGRLENKGTFNWINGMIQSVYGPIINTGTWNIEAQNQTLTTDGFLVDSLIYNSGIIDIAASVNALTLSRKMVNTGNIKINGSTKLNLLDINNYGGIIGDAGSTLEIDGGYFGSSNTFYTGSSLNVETFKTTSGTNVNIESGVNISTIQKFYLGQGTMELGVALPPAALYEISATINSNINQSFTGNFRLNNGSFTGNSTISFDTPNFFANFGYFNSQVNLSANTILDVQHLGISKMTNEGTINLLKLGGLAVSNPGLINNGIFNVNGDSTYIYGYNDISGFSVFKNNGTLNCNQKFLQINCVLENNGTINIASNADIFYNGNLLHYGTIEGQTNSKLTLASAYTVGHTFYPGSVINNLDELAITYQGSTFFKEGTLLNNLKKISVEYAILETEIVLPPAINYNFKKAQIRLNSSFQPTTVLQTEDTNIEGSGNIKINNSMNWNGGTMDVPLRIFENANVSIKENMERPIISAPFTNEGNITLSGGIIEINASFFKNAGTWNVDSDTDVIIDGFTAFTNEGVFSICGTQPIQISFNVPFINKPSGTFKGSGSYTFNAGFENEGTVAPGCSPGILTIEDNLSAPAMVEIEVTGSNTGEYDQLLVNGNMTAGAILNIVVPQGASLNGSIKVIQTTGTFTGTFAQVNMPPNFSVQYLADGLLLTSDGSVATQNINNQVVGLIINPTLASSFVVVSANQTIGKDAQLEVYNLNGQLVTSRNWNAGETQQEVNVEGLVNGVYTVKLTGLPLWKGMIVVNH
jgi:hypothetical protein